MSSTTHKAYSQTVVTYHSTSLNSLANNANSAASSAIDNTSALDLYLDLELVLNTQTARSAGATVQVFAVHALDATNYSDVNETTAELLGSFALDAAVTARRAVLRDIPVPPGLFELFVRNSTGQAFNAASNTLKGRFHSITTA